MKNRSRWKASNQTMVMPDGASKKVMSILLTVMLGVTALFTGMTFTAATANAATHGDGTNYGTWEVEVCIAPAEPDMGATPTQWCDDHPGAWGVNAMVTQAAYDALPQSISGPGPSLVVVARFVVTNNGPAQTTSWWTGGYAAGGSISQSAVLGYPRVNDMSWCYNESTATSSPDYADGVMPAGASVTFTCEIEEYGTTNNASMKMLPDDRDELASRGGQWNFVVGGQMTMCWTADLTECDGIVEEWGSGSMEIDDNGGEPPYAFTTDPTVTPAAACGLPATVNLPNDTGVVYTNHNPTVTEGSVRVTAAATGNYVIAPGNQTEWFLTLPAIVPCDEDVEVTPAAPTLNVSTVCDVPSTVTIPTVEGVVYTNHNPDATSGVVRVTAAPADGFVFPADAVTEWLVNLPAVVPCGGQLTVVSTATPTVTPSPAGQCNVPATVTLPDTTGVIYTNHNVGATEGVIRVTAAAADGYVLAEGTPIEWVAVLPPCEATGNGTGNNTGGNVTPEHHTPSNFTPVKASATPHHLTATGSEMSSTVILSAIGVLMLAGAAGALYMRRTQKA